MPILFEKVLARDRFVNMGILPNVNFTKKETGCKAGDKCLFPHHKVDEQPNKKQKKSDHSQKRRESDDKNVVPIVKIVKTRSYWILKEANRPGET